MDHQAHAVKIANHIGDIRSYVKDLDTIADKWPVRADHKRKANDMLKIMETMKCRLEQLKNDLEGK